MRRLWQTRTGRLWVYVRDDRSSGDSAPPAVWFRYSVDRKGEHPQRHLRDLRGILQMPTAAGTLSTAAAKSSKPRAGRMRDDPGGTCTNGTGTTPGWRLRR